MSGVRGVSVGRMIRVLRRLRWHYTREVRAEQAFETPATTLSPQARCQASARWCSVTVFGARQSRANPPHPGRVPDPYDPSYRLAHRSRKTSARPARPRRQVTCEDNWVRCDPPHRWAGIGFHSVPANRADSWPASGELNVTRTRHAAPKAAKRSSSYRLATD